MKKFFLCSILLLALTISGFSQVTIANWEVGSAPTFTGYPVAVSPTRVTNPSKTGINTSNYVECLTSLSDDNYELAYTNPALGYIDFTTVNTFSIKMYSMEGKRRCKKDKI